MSESEQKKYKQNSVENEEIEEVSELPVIESDLTEQIDDLLDEIDEVLESNAEEFVKSYIQKGGE